MSTWAEDTRAKLAHIKVLSIDELRGLPEAQPFQGGIYFLWQALRLIYVGKSHHVLERLNRLVRDRTYDRLQQNQRGIPFDSYTCLAIDGEGPVLRVRLQDLERVYIATYEPEWNYTDQNGGT